MDVKDFWMDEKVREALPMAALLVFLFPCCIWDIRRRVVPLRMVFIGLVLTGGLLLLRLFRREMDVRQAGICLLPGLLLLAVCLLAGGAVGSGDGLMWLIIGGVLQPWDGMAALLLAMLLIALWSGVLLLTGRAGRKTRLPFVPFSLAGGVLWMATKSFW